MSGLEIPDAMQGQSLVPQIAAEGSKRPEGWRRRPIIYLCESEAHFPTELRIRTWSSFGTAGSSSTHTYASFMTPGVPALRFEANDPSVSIVAIANEHPDKVEELAGHLESWRALGKPDKLCRTDADAHPSD